MADHSLYNVPGRTTLIPLEAAVDFTLGRRAEVGRVPPIADRQGSAMMRHSRLSIDRRMSDRFKLRSGRKFILE
jgi:hypothetical protein